MNEFKLTKNYQYSKRCKDGKMRNILSYYLNGILILKQKIPFNTNYDKGFDRRTAIYDEYLLNGNIHQKRSEKVFCGMKNIPTDHRQIYFPAKKNVLQKMNIPKDIKIEIYHEKI